MSERYVRDLARLVEQKTAEHDAEQKRIERYSPEMLDIGFSRLLRDGIGSPYDTTSAEAAPESEPAEPVLNDRVERSSDEFLESTDFSDTVVTGMNQQIGNAASRIDIAIEEPRD